MSSLSAFSSSLVAVPTVNVGALVGLLFFFGVILIMMGLNIFNLNDPTPDTSTSDTRTSTQGTGALDVAQTPKEEEQKEQNKQTSTILLIVGIIIGSPFLIGVGLGGYLRQ